MSRLHVGARAPWAVPFVVATKTLDGTTVERMLVRLVTPEGVVIDVNDASPITTTTSVTALWSLAADGSSVTEDGTWEWRAFFYDGANALLGWSEVFSLTVDKNPIAFPVIP